MAQLLATEQIADNIKLSPHRLLSEPFIPSLPAWNLNLFTPWKGANVQVSSGDANDQLTKITPGGPGG